MPLIIEYGMLFNVPVYDLVFRSSRDAKCISDDEFLHQAAKHTVKFRKIPNPTADIGAGADTDTATDNNNEAPDRDTHG